MVAMVLIIVPIPPFPTNQRQVEGTPNPKDPIEPSLKGLSFSPLNAFVSQTGFGDLGS